jgi:alkyl hydroperoxide reductase subunit F
LVVIKSQYEVIVIGAGPAGITASIYSARKNLKTLIIAKDLGGQAAIAGASEDYAGYQFISIDDLIKKYEYHIKNFNLEQKIGYEVKSIEKRESNFLVNTNDSSFMTSSIIIATGRKPKNLGIPGEKEFYGKGVTYCATCDAPLFKDKDVVVIGGGNGALYATISLDDYADKIHLLNSSDKLNGEPELIKKVEYSSKVKIINKVKVKEILGDEIVNSIMINRNNTKDDRIKVDGVFIEIGSEPVSIPINGVNKSIKTNSKNEILVDIGCETNIPGIFAAGDVTNIPHKQVITASGHGCNAGLSAFNYIKKQPKN